MSTCTTARSRISATRFVALAGISGLLGVSGLTLAQPASAGTITESVTITQNSLWSVPKGVTNVHIRAVGGGGNDGSVSGAQLPAQGGRGGVVDANVPVGSNEVLDIRVGLIGTSFVQGAGGSKGGRAGLVGLWTAERGSGYGGGASFVYRQGTVVAVAGGGGGAGSSDVNQSGVAGGDGGDGGGYRGYGGHSPVAGAGGVGSSGKQNGGDGKNARLGSNSGGGGGGGGGYSPTGDGGGAGGEAGTDLILIGTAGGGGAGGSNYSVDPNMQATVADTSTNGSVTITWSITTVRTLGVLPATLTASANNVPTGTPVTFTVLLAGNGQAELPAAFSLVNPTGTVTFGTYDIVTGVETETAYWTEGLERPLTWTVVPPPIGFVVWAKYSGDSNFAPWKSPYLAQYVTAVDRSISLSPTSVDFGQQLVGSTTTKSIKIANTGNTSWRLASANVNNPAFRRTGTTCPDAGLPVGKSCTVAIAFAPIVGGTTSSAVLVITDSFGITTTAALRGSSAPVVVTPGGPPVPPAVPVITAVSPNSGVKRGGTNVTITGTNLLNAKTILFGNTPATRVLCTATICTATSPAGKGTVDVRIVNPAGVSRPVSADQFLYR